MRQNHYPVKLIPHKGWQNPIPVHLLLDEKDNFTIGRRFEGNPNDYIIYLNPDMPELDLSSLIEIKRIFNLSTNLQGNAFKYRFNRFHQINLGKESWEHNSKSRANMLAMPLKEGREYECISSTMFVVGWKVPDVNGIPFPYTRNFSKLSELEECESKIMSDYDKNYEYSEKWERIKKVDREHKYMNLQGIIKVFHRPTNLNYWHYTIDLFPAECYENPVLNPGSKWKLKMAEQVQDILAKKAFVVEPKSECYCSPQWMLRHPHPAKHTKKARSHKLKLDHKIIKIPFNIGSNIRKVLKPRRGGI